MAKSKVRNLENLLKISIGHDVEVLTQENSFLTAPGEHYGSIMLSIKATILHKKSGEEEVLSLVGKILPANKTLRQIFDVDVSFTKEMLTYTQAIPALVEFQKEFNVADQDLINNLFPKCVAARTSIENNLVKVDENAVILFENLKLQGYFTEDRLKGLDKSATHVILTGLAKFHAVPIALKLKQPDVFQTKIRSCLLKNKGFDASPEMRKAFENNLLDSIKHWPELHQYLDKINKLIEADYQNSFVNRIPQEPWGTVVHNDFWTSNTMILRNEAGETIKSKIVDLQLLNYSSCVVDLIFLLFTSVQDDILEEHFDSFLKQYHNTFTNTLSTFKIDLEPFNFDNFLKELNNVAPTEVYHILIMLKPIYTEKGVITNDAENIRDEDLANDNLLGPNHRNKVKKTVLALAKRGWL